MSNTLTIAQARLSLEEPHDCTDGKDVLTLLDALFDGLVRYDRHMRYEPAIADSWEVTDEARTWTFHLREGICFHNGSPCDAEAVRYSLERMSRPDMGVTLGAPGVYHQYLDGMRVETPDSSTVKIILKEPMADLLDVLVTGYILPPEEVERLGPRFKDNPIGTGPCKFSEYKADESVTMTRNDAYFGGRIGPKKVKWLMVPDASERIELLRENRVQIAGTLPPDLAGDQIGVETQKNRGTTAFIIIFNAEAGPLADPRVRRALNLAVDRTAIIDGILGGSGYPLTGFVSPHHFGYNPEEEGPGYNPDTARTLLAEAGFPDGLTVTLDSPTSLPNEAVSLSRIVAQQWRDSGINVEVVYTEDREQYAHNVRLKKINDMCIFDSSPLSTYRVLKEKIDARFEGSWWQQFHNAEVEKLIDQASVTVSDSEREAVFKRCFSLLNEDPPWLYLYNYESITGVAPELSGWQLPSHGVIDVRGLQG